MRSLLLVLVACGGNSSGKHPDAMIDARPDAPPPPPGHYYFVIDHETVPTNNTEARADGLDLNGDGTVDNQFGMVLGTLSSMGFDIQGAVSKSVDTGATLMLADLYALDFANTAGATFMVYDGANPSPAPCNGSADAVCRHHLAGTGVFDIDANSPRDTPLAGKAVGGRFDLGPGHLPLQLAMFGGVPLHLHLIGARVRLSTVSADHISSGILAGAVPQSDMNTMVFPQMAASLVPIVQRDCCGLATSPGGVTCNPNATPSCGCTDGSTGKTMLGLLDTSPKDCVITAGEIQNNSLFMALFAPDVMVEGQMALSLGVTITAVTGGFAL
jgi:hypothetical protein